MGSHVFLFGLRASMLNAITTLFVMLLGLLLFGMRTEKIMLMGIYRWKIHTCRVFAIIIVYCVQEG